MSRHTRHKDIDSSQTSDARQPKSHDVTSNQSRPRLSPEQVQRLWDRRQPSRQKLVRVPSKIAELVEETEFEGLSDLDYEAGSGPAFQSDRDTERQGNLQKLITERQLSAHSFQMSLADIPNTADSLEYPDPPDVHSIVMAARRARGSGSIASTDTARRTEELRQESPDTVRSVPAVQPSAESIAPPPSLEEQRHALDECWDFLKSLYDLSSEGRDQLIAEATNPEAVRQTWDSCWNLCVCMRELEQANHTTLLPEHLEPTLRFSRLLIKALQSLELQNEHDTMRSLLRASITHNACLLDAILSSSDDTLHNADMLATHIRYIHALLKAITIQPHQLLDHIKGCWLLFGSIYGLLLTRKQHNARLASSQSADGTAEQQQQQVVFYNNQEHSHEQLIATAIDAGMNLCNLFRHGWSLTRSGRTSPSKHGSTASLHLSQYQISSSRHRPSYLSENEDDMPSPTRAPHTPEMQRFPNSTMPDTPLTVFEDIEDPIEEFQEERRQGILVLGPRGSVGHAGEWPPSVSEAGEKRGRERKARRKKV